MKKTVCLLESMLLAGALLAGCGKGDGTSVEKTGGGADYHNILPSAIEDPDSEPNVADGCEAAAHDNSDCPPQYLSGVWVLEGSSEKESSADDDSTSTTGTSTTGYASGEQSFMDVSATDNMMKVEIDGEKKELEQFPVQLDLGPVADDPFSACGVRIGTLLFHPHSDGYVTTMDEATVVYDTSDGVLALGILDHTLSIDSETGDVTLADGSAVSEVAVTEIDYEMEWTGYTLQLTYDGETVTYVAEDVDRTGEIAFQADAHQAFGGIQTSSFGLQCNAALLDGEEPVDDILYVSPGGEEPAITYSLELEQDADYDFSEDGTVKITPVDRASQTYTYRYSGRNLILYKDEQSACYSMLSAKSDNGFVFEMVSLGLNVNADLYADGEKIPIACGYMMEQVAENSFTGDVDLTQTVEAGEIVEMQLAYNGEPLEVKAVNCFAAPVPLAYAKVAYYRAELQETNIVKETDMDEDVQSMQEVFDYYHAPLLSKSENTMTYKPGFAVSPTLNYVGINEEVSIEDDGEREITFCFEDDVMDAVEISAPSLLYGGLQDNVDDDTLAELSPSYYGTVTEVRDTILDKLEEAFTAAGVSVDIDENTGEVVMSNGILFGVDESDLSDEGKTYVDSFMNAYASVLMSDEFVELISEIAIEGHTDTTGSYAYNQVLSQERAESVLNWCLESTTNGLDDAKKEKLKEVATATGYSFADPILDAQGNVDMDASRRVAIKFYIDVEAAGVTVD